MIKVLKKILQELVLIRKEDLPIDPDEEVK